MVNFEKLQQLFDAALKDTSDPTGRAPKPAFPTADTSPQERTPQLTAGEDQHSTPNFQPTPETSH